MTLFMMVKAKSSVVNGTGGLGFLQISITKKATKYRQNQKLLVMTNKHCVSECMHSIIILRLVGILQW